MRPGAAVGPALVAQAPALPPARARHRPRGRARHPARVQRPPLARALNSVPIHALNHVLIHALTLPSAQTPRPAPRHHALRRAPRLHQPAPTPACA